MVIRCLQLERLGRTWPLGAGYFLVGLERFPQLRILKYQNSPIAVIYKYLDGTIYHGGYFPIFQRLKHSDLNESTVLEFFRNLPELVSGLVPPRSLHLRFDRVLDFGVEQFPKVPDWNLGTLPVFPSVYTASSPYVGPLLQMASQKIQTGHKVLVIGSGSGIEAVFLARRFRTIIDAVDINPMAVENTKASAMKAGVESLVRAWVSDTFERVRRRYDRILFNAPFPVETGDRSDPNMDDVGGKILDSVLQNASRYLRPNGEVLLMSQTDLSARLPEELSCELLFRFQVDGRDFGISSVKERPCQSRRYQVPYRE